MRHGRSASYERVRHHMTLYFWIFFWEGGKDTTVCYRLGQKLSFVWLRDGVCITTQMSAVETGIIKRGVVVNSAPLYPPFFELCLVNEVVKYYSAEYNPLFFHLETLWVTWASSSFVKSEWKVLVCCATSCTKHFRMGRDVFWSRGRTRWGLSSGYIH